MATIIEAQESLCSLTSTVEVDLTANKKMCVNLRMCTREARPISELIVLGWQNLYSLLTKKWKWWSKVWANLRMNKMKELVREEVIQIKLCYVH